MPLHLQRVLVDLVRLPQRRSGLQVRSFVDREADGRSQEGERHPGVLRPHRAAPAAAGELERRRLRPAGAAAARAAPRRRRRQVLGHGRRRPRVPLQQLHQPLPPAPHRPDGPAGDVPAARQRAARRDGQAVRLSRQARHGRLAGLRRLSRRPHRRDPALLRDRRDEHLPAVVPLREDARPPRRGRLRARDRARPRHGRRASTSRTGASTSRPGRSNRVRGRVAPAPRSRRPLPPSTSRRRTGRASTTTTVVETTEIYIDSSSIRT